MATANLPSLPHRGAPTTPLSWPLDEEAGPSPRRKAAPTRKLTAEDREAIEKAHAASRPNSRTKAQTGAQEVSPRGRTRSRTARIPSLLKNPTPWLAAVLAGNLVLYAATVAHETHLSRWRSRLGVQKQTNVQLRATLAAAKSLPWIDMRARNLGLTNPTMIAYLPPLAPAAKPRPAGPIGFGAAPGF